MKKFYICFLSIFLFAFPVYAAQNLRQPQGRIGVYYRPEAYNPEYKSNISNEELQQISKLIKQLDKKKNKNNSQQRTNDTLMSADIYKNSVIKNEINDIKIIQQTESTNIANNNEKNSLKAKSEKSRLGDDMQKHRKIKKLNVAEKTDRSEKKNKMSELFKQNKLVKYDLSDEEQNKINEFKKAHKEDFTQSKNENIKKAETLKKESKKSKLTPVKNEKQDVKTDFIQDYTTKEIVKEISSEINDERVQMLNDLRILWVSSVQKSDTVYFAVMKLSNPNGEEVNKKGFQKILEPIIGAAPIVGQAFVNPALTAGSIIGSNLMGSVMNDSATQRLTKVNDADLVILARAIDELQQTLVINYLAYKNAYKEYQLAIKIADIRRKEYETFNENNSPNIILANTFYNEALDNQYKARQNFLMKRVVLEQMAGLEALTEIEKNASGNEILQEKSDNDTKQ